MLNEVIINAHLWLYLKLYLNDTSFEILLGFYHKWTVFSNDSRLEIWYCEILENIMFFYISNVRRMQECFCYVKDIML